MHAFKQIGPTRRTDFFRSTPVDSHVIFQERSCLKQFGKVKGKNGVQSFIRDEHVLILHIKRDTSWHSQYAFGSAYRPFRWNVAIVVDAPDSYVGFIGRKFGVGTRALDADNDFTFWRIDGNGSPKVVQMTGGTTDDSLWLHVARIGAVEKEEPG